jgi:hypothetical protein
MSRLRDWLPQFFSNLWVGPKRWSGDGGYSYIYASNRQDTWRKRAYVESFNCVPEVNAVINMKANAFSNGVFKVKDKKGKEFPDEPILETLNNPNWFQAKGEFMKQTKIGHEVFGNELLYMLSPVGMPENIKALYTIMFDMVIVEYNETLPFFLFSKESPPTKVRYAYKDHNGTEKELDIKDVIHYNDNRIGGVGSHGGIKGANSPTDKNLLLGQSKLEVLTAPINNIRAAYESRGTILIERGANGAWVPGGNSADSFGGSVPLRPEDITELQDKFAGYGTMEGQRQFIISPRNIRFEQAGNFKPKDLGLFEETEEDFRKIQDEYGTPAELFARPDGTTYENQRQARKGMYVDTVIPEATEWTNGLSMRVYPNRDKVIVLDYSHLEIFQDDIKLKAEKVKAIISNLSLLLADRQITEQEYREEIAKHGLGNGKKIPVEKPAEDKQDPETLAAQAALRGSVGGVQGILAIQASVSQGTTTRESALSMLTIVYGFSVEDADKLLGKPAETGTITVDNTDEPKTFKSNGKAKTRLETATL